MSLKRREFTLGVIGICLLMGCSDNSNPMGQANSAANSAIDWAKKQTAAVTDKLGGAGDIFDGELPGQSEAAAEQEKIKQNIDPQFAFVQTYLSGRWVQEPYSGKCDGESGHYIEFSFDGDTVTQYDRWGSGSVVVTVATITSAKQLNKSLGRGKTLVGEISAHRVSTKGRGGSPQGFFKPKIALISGDFSENSPSFSGKGLYSNGQSVGVGFPQLMSCSGSFEKREYP